MTTAHDPALRADRVAHGFKRRTRNQLVPLAGQREHRNSEELQLCEVGSQIHPLGKQSSPSKPKRIAKKVWYDIGSYGLHHL